MQSKTALALAWLLAVTAVLSAQELVPPPQPDSTPTGPPPAALPPSVSQVPPAGTAAPYYPPPPPFGSNAPPGGPYAPLPAPPPSSFFASDPAGNPTLWLGFEGLIWWTRSQPLSVPVVTTGPAAQGDNAGNLGAPGTQALNQSLQYGAVGGFRFFAGGWFDSGHTIGMDGSLFLLGQQSAGFVVADRSQAGNAIINEPVSGAPFSTQVSAPGVETGSVLVDARSRFGGGDLNVLYNLARTSAWTINLLAGYRYLELDESLNIAPNSGLFTTATYTDNLGNILATAPPGSSIAVLDQFRTRNQFNGGQLGTSFQYLWNRWTLGGSAKVALGATRQAITINGNTTVFPVSGDPVPLQGGNFATLQVGRYVQNRFAVAPELQMNLGYQFTPILRGQIGYSLLYLSSVARPGNQIDNAYDGLVHPLVPMSSSSFWAQGLNIGLQLRF